MDLLLDSQSVSLVCFCKDIPVAQHLKYYRKSILCIFFFFLFGPLTEWIYGANDFAVAYFLIC